MTIGLPGLVVLGAKVEIYQIFLHHRSSRVGKKNWPELPVAVINSYPKLSKV